MKKHYADPWIEYTKRYEKLYWAPGKPTNEEKRIYYKFIKAALERNRLKKAKALVLGATPALRDLLAKFNIEITCVDISMEIIEAMTKLIKHKKKEKFVKASWIRMPFPSNYFDIILGDLVLGNVDARNTPKFLKEIKRVLKKDGYWITRIFYVPADWKIESTEEILEKFSKMKHNYDRNTELFCYLLYNFYNEKKHECYTNKIKKALAKYWKGGRYHYPDKIVEGIMNRMYEMWKPFKKIWHVGTKKEVFAIISKQFNIVEEDYAKDHLFGRSYPVIFCKVKK